MITEELARKVHTEIEEVAHVISPTEISWNIVDGQDIVGTFGQEDELTFSYNIANQYYTLELSNWDCTGMSVTGSSAFICVQKFINELLEVNAKDLTQLIEMNKKLWSIKPC